MSFKLKMRGLREFIKTSQQRLHANKEMFDQFLDHVSIVSIASMCLPVYIIARKHWKTPEQSPLTNRKYVLVGNKTTTEQVEHRIRRKLGEPISPIFLMKWRYTEIEKVGKKEQFEKLKNEKKPITLYLCTSTTNDHSKEEFFLPDNPNDLPSKIEKKSIIVVKKAGDELEEVKTCVQSLCNITGIKAIFNNTNVLEFIPDKNKELDIQSEVALLTIAVYLLAALIFIIRKKV